MRWAVIPATSLKECRRLKSGELMRHQSGVTVLCCPQCGKLQWTSVSITGPDNAPTLVEPVTCGAGFCTRCAVRFTIEQGEARILEKHTKSTVHKRIELPLNLVCAGIK